MKITEAQTFSSKLVQHRSFNISPEATNVTIAHVIGNDDEDVGFAVLRWRR